MVEEGTGKVHESTTFINADGDEVNAWGQLAQSKVTDSAQVTDSAEVTDGDYSGDSQYKDWTNAQLVEEVRRRREAGRDVHLNGRTKADAIAALDEDDRAAEAGQNQG